jgi:hypothetical protein
MGVFEWFSFCHVLEMKSMVLDYGVFNVSDGYCYWCPEEKCIFFKNLPKFIFSLDESSISFLHNIPQCASQSVS